MQQQPKKRPIWKRAAEKLGLSIPLVLMMAKYVLQQADHPILYVCIYMLGPRHPSSNPPWTLSFLRWSSIRLTRPLQGRHCSDCWPCHVCTYLSRCRLCSWTDPLQIPECYCCQTLFDNWLSHPDHVYTHSSGNASCQVSPKPHGDFSETSAEPYGLLLG
jgi:hypothetical protein